MKVAWLTDPHFICEGYISGYDPRLRLSAAVSHINDHCQDCAFCIVSGDLVDLATPENYRSIKDTLDQLAIPYFVMMGNHDERVGLRAEFELPEGVMPDFVQYAVSTEAGLFVCLDTKTEGTDGGFMCSERLDWLSHVLRESQDDAVYIFMHHPPVRLDLATFDEIGLKNAGALLDILEKHNKVKHIFAGHVHQSISGHARSIPFTIGRSTVYQSLPSRPPWGWEDFAPVDVEPTYNVIHFAGSDVVVHSVPFCDRDYGKQ